MRSACHFLVLLFYFRRAAENFLFVCGKPGPPSKEGGFNRPCLQSMQALLIIGNCFSALLVPPIHFPFTAPSHAMPGLDVPGSHLPAPHLDESMRGTASVEGGGMAGSGALGPAAAAPDIT